MKSIIIGIVIAALLIGGIAGASVLYNNLSEEYNKDHNGGFEQMNPIGEGAQNTENTTSEKVEYTSEEHEITTDKVEDNTESGEETNEKLEETDESSELTSENPEETTEQIEVTTEKIEETTEKAEIVFNAPDFTMLDWDGNNVKLSDYAGKPIVLNFWATWCTYCKQEMPEFDEAAKNLTDVQFIMLNTNDTMSTAKKYVESQGFEFDVLFDTTNIASYTYGVSAFPTTFFISADGSEIYYISGMLSYDTLLQGISLITD